MIEGAPLLQRLVSTKLSWAGARFGVLAQNLANADTPDYEARDIKGLDFDRLINNPTSTAPSRVAMTHADHMRPAVEPASDYRAREADAFEVSPTGNSVVVEEQMQKLGETQMDYQMATSVYGKFKGFLKSAMGDTRA